MYAFIYLLFVILCLCVLLPWSVRTCHKSFSRKDSKLWAHMSLKLGTRVLGISGVGKNNNFLTALFFSLSLSLSLWEKAKLQFDLWMRNCENLQLPVQRSWRVRSFGVYGKRPGMSVFCQDSNLERSCAEGIPSFTQLARVHKCCWLSCSFFFFLRGLGKVGRSFFWVCALLKELDWPDTALGDPPSFSWKQRSAPQKDNRGFNRYCCCCTWPTQKWYQSCNTAI